MIQSYHNDIEKFVIVGERDLAIYLQDHAHEIEFGKERYEIVPHSAILMLIREDF